MEPEELWSRFTANLQEKATSPSHAAIKTLAQVLESSTQQTIQGISKELETSSASLVQALSLKHSRSPLSVIAACDMFRNHARKTLIDSVYSEFSKTKEEIIRQGYALAALRETSIHKITEVGLRCFRDNITILIHGCSQVVYNVLVSAARKFSISVLVTECRPFCEGYTMCKKLSKHNVKFSFILDSAVASVMEGVDIVIVGAEAVVESGGVINRIGTYGISVIAKAFRKPFYVCAESLKFVRLFPLSQRDLPKSTYSELNLLEDLQCVRGTVTAICDFTPPEHITLLFTDLGILTPSAISDELIQLYS